METANDLVDRFMFNLENREQSLDGAAPCLSAMSPVVPPQARVLSLIRKEICPNELCSDVDRAILGASLGG